MLNTMNDEITKKKANEALEKENHANKMALAQCIFELEEAKEQIKLKTESLNETMKQNILIKEQLKVKDKLIDSLRKSEVQDETTENIHESTDNSGAKMDNQTEFKCNQCNFRTEKRHILTGHKVAHTVGQYQCQRGCKLVFKTWKNLDEHIKKEHAEKQQSNEYKCDQCDETFTAQYHLRQHLAKKHVRLHSNPEKFDCDLCGLIVQNDLQLIRHKLDCTAGFEKVTKQICRYFLNDRCWRGNQCKFVHKEESMINNQNLLGCKNGPGCSYFRNGSCRYSHENVRNESQHRRFDNKFSHKWCIYEEGCFNLPNCSFIHKESDFPKLPQTSKPPIPENIAMWQDY